jgi:hypothetical protein
MSSADLTRRALSFGAQDSVTGWYELVRSDSTIKGSIQPQGASVGFLPCGSYSKYSHTLFTEYVVHEGDQIVDADLDVYELNTVTKWSWLDKFSHRVCEAVKQTYANRAATSGTWHTAADSLTTDPRSRHKIYLDTHLSVSPSIITCFDGADYPIKYLFTTALGLDLDCVVSIGKDAATSLLDYQQKTYAFIESVPITIYGLSPNEVESVEQSIRHVFTDHPIVAGRTIRSMQSVKHQPIDIGGRTLWSTTLTVRYKRANDEYVAADTLTYGSGGGAGTFTFPNIIHYKQTDANRDLFSDMPGRLGDYPFLLGAKSQTITLTCDLGVNPDAVTWLRAGDSIPWQIFKDIIGNGVTEASQVLTVAGEQHAVRLRSELDLSPDNHAVTLYFTEYNASPADSNYKTRSGIS